jgi:hypothetical protein
MSKDKRRLPDQVGFFRDLFTEKFLQEARQRFVSVETDPAEAEALLCPSSRRNVSSGYMLIRC